MQNKTQATNPLSSRELVTPQATPALTALLTRYALEVHPQIYDCRSCSQDYNHCPQQMIDQGAKGQVWAVFNGCSDPRANPGVVFQPKPGDMFPVVTAGAILTAYYNKGGTTNSWGSIEYAVGHLGVRDLVHLGHTECGAMAGLVALARGSGVKGRHLRPMLNEVRHIAKSAEDRFVKDHGRVPHDAELQRAIEYENARFATRHLQEYADNEHPDLGIRVHGWVYDVRAANILALQPSGAFEAITHLPQRADYGALPSSCDHGVREITHRLVYKPMHKCGQESCSPACG